MNYLITKFLKYPNKKSKQSIYISIWYDGNRVLRYSTRIKVLPKDWSNKKQQSKHDSYINIKLKEEVDRIEKEIQSFDLDNKRLPDINKLKEICDGVISKSSGLFIEYFREYIDRGKTSQNKPMAKSTKSIYERVYDVLESNFNRLSFGQVDLRWLNTRLIPYLESDGLSTQTIGEKYIKQIKCIMDQARREKLHSNYDYQDFKVIRAEAKNKLSLTPNQVSKLINSDEIPEELQNTRDLFLLLIFSGQRVSDLGQLIPSNVKDDTINIIQTKTGTSVSIPLRPEISRIWFKNGGNIIKVSDQALNRNLKDLAEYITDLNDDEKEILTSKVARRTFATILYNEGQSLGDIMVVTGHKTEKSLRAYLDIDNIAAIKRVSSTWDKVLAI